MKTGNRTDTGEGDLSNGDGNNSTSSTFEDSFPESNLEKGIVGWDDQKDPANPRNFSKARKWSILGFVSLMSFLSPLASSMFAPGVQFMNASFHNESDVLSSLVVSIYLLGYVFGPLVLSPLSEIYGRRPVLFTANSIFVIWQIGCAKAPNLAALIVFRLLAGIGGSGCLTIGGGIISDLFNPTERGAAMAAFSIGPLIGPVIGPIAGGFLSQQVSWRWVFWVLLIASGTATVGIEVFNTETNPEVIIQKKTNLLAKQTNRPDLRNCYRKDESLTSFQIIKSGILVPIRLLFATPISFILSLYMSLVYGLLYLLFTTITGVYEVTYRWSPQLCGLAYLGIGLGFFVGLGIVAKSNDKTVVTLTRSNGGVYEPEMRLAACGIFAVFIPISFFWYGWAVENQAHWVVPIIGMIPFGFGMIGVFIPIQTYMVDAFPKYAASAVAALTAMRSLFGAFLPLAGPQMYATLGYGWGNSLLGFISVALVPVPYLIYKFGGYLRKK
ncbi:major facilitator superfamily domain-containing protein [Aspergillus pseudotamarii]|uniref:Major facilitator superfamily domain-containing protein n=1 Tax=Aspergillus pseudotamarii TaxID=132259 RepID=A0A5N6S8D2_ASPPS|nr:major facilitator superfamily domain-containing protein [Aspergillus pseudotamarii]KAE8130882.1 major facilitator superfamily domain-containing protein [Aspergillus pseudotamarii]